MAYHGILPREWVDELNSRTDIYDVISSLGVELKPKGGRYWACCPFHGEKTPSFSVSRQKQMFYCFGCHKGGTVITFVQEYQHMTFPEACEYLASRCGLEMPAVQERDEEIIRREAHKKRLKAACHDAAVYYYKKLLGKVPNDGLKYFIKRGLNKDCVKRFCLGWAPNEWTGLYDHLTGLGYTEEEMIEADLISHNAEKNRSYDRFRGRVIYPIKDARGDFIGFGARVLDDSKPKYLNTGETTIYLKRNTLYGLDLQNGVKLDHLIIVEGYMDVIGLYLGGVTNAVASCGTALTEEQAKLLKRYVSLVYIAYDGDAAGQHGMVRGLDILKRHGLEVRVIVFPDDLDPDEFVRERGADAFAQLKEKALSLDAFHLEVMAREYRFDDPNDRGRYAQEACAYLSKLDPVGQEQYLPIVHDKTGFSMDVLRRQLSSLGSGAGLQESTAWNPQPLKQYKAPQPLTVSAQEKALSRLLHVMLLSRDAAEFAVTEDVDDPLDQGIGEDQPVFRAAFDQIAADYAMEQTPSAANLLTALQDQGLTAGGAIAEGLYDDAAVPEPVKFAHDCIDLIRHEQRQAKIAELKEKRNSLPSGSPEKAEMLTEIQKLLKEDDSLWKRK